MRKRAVLLLFATGVLAAFSAEAREGFGFTKKAVEMTRTRPPSLNIVPRRVKVLASSDRTKESDDAQTLKRYTEDALLGGAATLATSTPELSVKLIVDRLDSHETWENKKDYEYRKVGTKQEWNAKKNRYETKDVYDNVEVVKNVKVLKASLAGNFEITDKSGHLLDSGDLTEEYSDKFEEGRNSPTPGKVEDELLRHAATKIASRLVPTKDSVTLIVPKGSFESFIPLAEANTWDRYLAAVGAIQPMRDARAEAYRQYALAVGEEGLAYSTADRARAVELLRSAVDHYQGAIRGNPGERIFAESYSSLLSSGAGAPLPRAQASLAAYEAWSAGSHGASTAAGPKGGGSGRMTNEALIEMAKAGLADENLILAIDAADEVDFNTSPNALIALSKAGVSKNVIAAMQKRAKRK